MRTLWKRWNSLSFRLPALIVLFSTITGLVGSGIAYSVARSGFLDDAKERVELVRNERARAVTTLINDTRVGLASLVTRPGLARDFEDLSSEFTKLSDAQRTTIIGGYTSGNPFPPGSRSALTDLGDGSGYTEKHKAIHDRLMRIVQIKDLDDLLVVDAKGNVVYTVMKGDDFGTNFLSGPYHGSNAAKVFRGALTTQPPWDQSFADMAPYGPSGDAALFMGQAVRSESGQVAGVLIFRLNNRLMRDAVNHIQDLGETGEVYLVGPDGTRRSQTRFYTGHLMAEEVKSESATRSTAGFTATTITKDYSGNEVISSYAPLNLMGVRWGIISKIGLNEALSPLNTIAIATAAGVLASTFLIALLGYASARRVSGPLARSLRVMDKLSHGNLHVEIEDDGNFLETQQITAALRTFHGNLLETDRLVSEVTKSQEQLSGLLDSSPTGVIVLSANNEILFANDPAALILGKEKSAFIGTTFTFVDIAVSQADVHRMISTARRDGSIKAAELQIRVPGKDDAVLSLSVRKTVYVSKEAFLIWFNDITDQKTLQNEVAVALATAQQERARTDAILDGAPDPIVIVRPDSTIEYINDQLTRVLGYTASEIVGRQLEMLLPQRFRGGHISKVLGFFEAGKARMMGEGRELFALTKSGHEVPVAIALSPVTAGGRSLVVAAVRDITEQKKAAAALRESQQLLSGVVQNSATVIFVKRDGRYVMVNKAWEKMTGISAEAARNKTDLEVFDELNARRIMENDATVIASRAPAEYEEPVSVGDKTIHFLSLKFPFFDANGNVDGLCGMSTDITDRIAAEHAVRDAMEIAEAATRAKSNFLASMSHEIRTPMNGITGMAEILGQTNLDDEQRHMLRTIRESGNALITVINDILDFSKIEAGKLDLENVTMSVVDAVEGVAATLTPNAAKKGLRIHVFVDPNIPNAVQGDPTRLRQILFNLGGNAIKFSDGNDVQIRATLINKFDERGTWLRFSIIDHGIGITAENQAKLFQAFSQAESSTTRRFGGTGLGLAICKRLVEMIGGTIEIESQEGRGSTFWVDLPFQVADEVKSNQKERDLRGLRVLLVGSEGPRAEAIDAYLQHWGAEVSSVQDTDAAAPILTGKDNAPFDSIVLDLGLDDDRQSAAIEALRHIVNQTIPMIVLQDYQHRGARITGKDLVTIDANPLVRYRIISAVAVAAGRASPEIKSEEEAIALKPAKALTIEEARASGQLILLAEDNLTNQDVIRRQLNLIGYTCEIVNDGNEALEAYTSGRYALLLTDCHMPEMDGYDLTTTIRELEKGTKQHLPIVAVTANALQGEAERCLAVGMDDYISKPIAMPALVAAMKKWMPAPVDQVTGPQKEPTVERAAADSTASDQAIDDRAIKDMFGDDEETFRDILQSFVGPSQEIIGEIIDAWEQRTADGVKDAAHKLKSSARTVGAHRLADTCAALEAAGKAADWSIIDRLAPEARDRFQDVEAYISRACA